jgi:hypothetical protein
VTSKIDDFTKAKNPDIQPKEYSRLKFAVKTTAMWDVL